MILSGLVFFAWGEIYSLFPATCGDTYGSSSPPTNAGLLYTAKGTAVAAGALRQRPRRAGGNWHTVFVVAAIMNAIAAVMALAVLKPLRAADRRSVAAAAE